MRLISAPAAAPSSHLQAFSAPQWTVVGIAGVCLDGQRSLQAHTVQMLQEEEEEHGTAALWQVQLLRY